MNSRNESPELNQNFLVRLIMLFPKGTIWQTRYICLPVVIIASTLALSNSTDLSWSGRAFWYLLGLFAWTLVEYMVHRWVFHWVPKTPVAEALLKRFHIEHHRVPADQTQVCLPPFLLFPVWSLSFLGFALLGANTAASLVFICGFALMQVIYDITHFSTHYMEPSNGILKRLKKQHMLHHFADEKKRFGVTTPFWDYVFGTYQ